jgi:small subunit ribosomal protein S6
MRTYEITLIFPEREEEYSSGIEFVRNELGKINASIVKEDDMGERALAYPVKKETRGHYACFTAEMEPEKVADLDKSFKLNNSIIKFLFIKKE